MFYWNFLECCCFFFCCCFDPLSPHHLLSLGNSVQPIHPLTIRMVILALQRVVMSALWQAGLWRVLWTVGPKSIDHAWVTAAHFPGWSCQVPGLWVACCFPVRIQRARPTAPLSFMNGIQKDTYISINKLGIQWLLPANQGRLINLASCLINELWLITY